MKVKPSRQIGHVLFDIGARDVRLLATPNNASDPISSGREEDDAFVAQLNERATKQTSVLEEILSNSLALASLDRKETDFRAGASHS